jgi:hypothetical protein
MGGHAAKSRQQDDARPAGLTGAIDAMANSWIQRLVVRFLPRSWAEAAEADSRQWMVRCRSCGFERSIWDLGGVRWKGKRRSKTWGRCDECGKRGWHTIYRRDLTGPAGEE